LVREGCNKTGRFLEVAVEADGGRKGTIWLPEGRKGWGWRLFVSEMKRMLEFQGVQIEPIVDEYPSLLGKWVEVEEFVSSGSHYGRSFMNVLRSTVGGLKRLSSYLLYVLPVSECFEVELGGVEPRSAVDCYAMEAKQISSKELLVVPSPASLSQAAADSLKTMVWVQLQVELIRKEVDQALGGLIAGLELKPNGSQNRAELLGHEGSALGSVPEPDPASDLGFSSTFGSDLSDPLPAASTPGLSVLGNPLGNDGFLAPLELGAATIMLGDKDLDITSESPDHTGIKPVHAGDPLFGPLSPQRLSSNTIVDFGLTKSQNWLLASLRKAVQDDVVHLALVKDMEESWRQARKEVREVLSTEEDDWNLASLKDELEWLIGGRKGPQTRSKGKREHRRVVSGMGKTNVG
jgi:hypothetical protein